MCTREHDCNKILFASTDFFSDREYDQLRSQKECQAHITALDAEYDKLNELLASAAIDGYGESSLDFNVQPFQVHFPFYLWPQVLEHSRAKDEIGDVSVSLLVLYHIVSRFGFILVPGAAKQQLGNQSSGQAALSINFFLRDKKRSEF